MTNWSASERQILTKFANRGAAVVYDKLIERGYERTPEAIGRAIRRLRHNRILKDGIKVGYLDIESTGLNSTFGHLLTWAIKERGVKEVQFDVIKREDILKYRGDKRIIKSLVTELSKYDHIVTYYGGMKKRRFDLRMIFTRALHYNIPFPKYGELTNSDMYDVACQRLSLHNYRLDTVAKHLKVESQKSPISWEAWQKGALGHRGSLKEILKHNILDVKVLEEVEEKLRDYSKGVRGVM